ncbi:MAG: D-2-hydroxyacid dehydrogenase family protein [Pseudomonadota bacterium]
MKILILDDFQQGIPSLPSFGRLAGHEVTVLDRPLEQVSDAAAILAHAEGLIPMRERSRIDETLLARMPALRCISQTGKAGKHIDLQACSRRGILVAEGAGTSYATAELAFLLMMSALRNLVQEIDGMKAGRFGISLGRTLKGRTLGIIGYGNVGRQLAKFASAFGMTVMVYGSEAAVGRADADGYRGVPDRELFFASCDAISVHLRLTPETRAYVREADLLRMKPGSVLINTARVEVVDPAGLLNALRQGRPAQAAVDVYAQEPPTAASDPLIAMKNVIATPHIGFLDVDSFDLMVGAAIDNLLAVAAGDVGAVLNRP